MIPITSTKTLGNVLKRYRKDLGLTQAEAGKQFCLHQTTISGIESGHKGVRLDTVFRYMAALGLEIEMKSRTEFQNDKSLW